MTIRETLTRTISRLAQGGIESATAEAEWILCDLLKIPRITLCLQGTDEFPSEHIHRLEDIICARLARQPLQYILGYTGFYGRRFTCDPRALIPRPETEILVGVVLSFMSKNHPAKKNLRHWVWDIGTGCGNIAVSLAAERQDLFVLASDIDRAALELAEENVRANHVEDRVVFLNSSLFDPVPPVPRFVAICSNPPYVSPESKGALPREVREFEPPHALYAPMGGLSFMRMIINEASDYLKPGGMLALEIGFDQAEAVRDYFKSNPDFTDFTLTKDLTGHDRVAGAIRV